jgi:hypothetical protein
MNEPVLEYEGQTMGKEGIWELYTESLFEHRDGVEQLLEIMVQLGMSDLEEQKCFVAMATELRLMAQLSPAFVNVAQLFVLFQKWGLSLDRFKQLKSILETDEVPA